MKDPANYSVQPDTHHDTEEGEEIAASVHNVAEESWLPYAYVPYDVTVQKYKERNQTAGFDIAIRTHYTDQERERYRYIRDSENRESVVKEVEQMIESKLPLTHQQAVKATGLVSNKLKDLESPSRETCWNPSEMV